MEARSESPAGAGMRSGLALLPGPFARAEEAFEAAAGVLARLPVEPGFPPLEIIGEFVLPPPEGPPSRDFQALHFDFGLPIDPAAPGEVARYTALHVPIDRSPSAAVTRFVALDALLAPSAWPDRDELLARLISYGEGYGGETGSRGTSRGISPE